jgi:hypothetical protein
MKLLNLKELHWQFVRNFTAEKPCVETETPSQRQTLLANDRLFLF